MLVDGLTFESATAKGLWRARDQVLKNLEGSEGSRRVALKELKVSPKASYPRARARRTLRASASIYLRSQ